MSSSRYFLANSMNPFMGLLGLSQSLSFLVLAGEFTPVVVGGGDPLRCEAAEATVFDIEGWKAKAVPWIARGESSAAEVVNSNRLKRSHKSGVRMASGWFGGRQISPERSS